MQEKREIPKIQIIDVPRKDLGRYVEKGFHLRRKLEGEICICVCEKEHERSVWERF